VFTLNDENFNDKTKKIAVIGAIVAICVGIMVLTGDSDRKSVFEDNSILDTKEVDVKSPVLLSEVSDEMPPMSTYTYLTEDYRAINDVVSGGAFIENYRRIFTNTLRQDYDINATYEDFNTDFARYARDIRNTISKIEAMRPEQPDGRLQQRETLEKMNRLYATVSSYDEQRNIKQTIKFLNDCRQDLQRLQQQQKLPY
jgi:hypothetical protein